MKNDTTGAHSTFVMLGATNHSNEDRQQYDYYATDPAALQMLLDLETFSENIWEPACGAGHLSEVLIERGFTVRSSDLYNHGYGETGIDFLQTCSEYDGDIVTNPPYKYAREFVEHALHTVADGHRVAMLLRLNFLEGKARRKLFEQYPPRVIYVSTARINCCKNGDFSKEQRGNNSAQAYAWFIWDKGYTGDTVVRWFN